MTLFARIFVETTKSFTPISFHRKRVGDSDSEAWLTNLAGYVLDSIWFSFCCIFSHLFLPFPVYFSNANASSILSNIQLMFNSRKVLISKMGQSLKMMCTAHLFELSRLHCAAGFIVNPEEHEGGCLKCKILQYVSRCTVYFCYSFIVYVLKTRELV